MTNTPLGFEQVEPFGGREPSSPLTRERLRRRRFWLAIALTVLNCSALIQALQDLATRPSSTFLMLSKEQVTLYRDTAGKESYGVTVPLQEFPYDLQLRQRDHFAILSLVAANLILLAGILHVHWRESRLNANKTPAPE